MPIKTQGDLPAKVILESENIFIMDEEQARSQNIRPLEILILNLMPNREETETQLLRALSNTPIPVECTFMTMESFEPGELCGHFPCSRLNKPYVVFDDIRGRQFDGMVITDAPLEDQDFEEVDIWEKLTEILKWSETHVNSVIYQSWSAQAGLSYHYGIPKHVMKSKLFGVYSHKVLDKRSPLVRGFDDSFFVPHSRSTQVRREDIEKHSDLMILAESRDAGVFLVMSRDGRQIYVLGHPEYDRLTLDNEYHRDLRAGLNPQLPFGYYENDDPDNIPPLTWRSHGNLLYMNWLTFYLY